MTSVSAQEIVAVRARAIRVLLARPLIDRRSGTDFTAIVAHAQWLQRWFDDKCGWVLVVDARHGFARLRKVPAQPSTHRGAFTHRSTPRPFSTALTRIRSNREHLRRWQAGGFPRPGLREQYRQTQPATAAYLAGEALDSLLRTGDVPLAGADR